MVFFCICCRRCVRELEGWILLSPPWNISINCQQDCCPSALWLTGAAVWYTALWLQWDGQKDTVKERKCGLHRLERKWWILVTRGCNRCVHRGQGPVGEFTMQVTHQQIMHNFLIMEPEAIHWKCFWAQWHASVVAAQEAWSSELGWEPQQEILSLGGRLRERQLLLLLLLQPLKG